MSFIFRRSSTTTPTLTGRESSSKSAQLISVGKAYYVGKLLKKGHWRQNWTQRHFVIRGSTMSYYATAEDAKAMENPKGVHIIREVKDDQPSSLSWIVDTVEDKSFELRATSMSEKTRFLDCMKKAVTAHQRRSSLDPRGPHTTGQPRVETSIDDKLHAALELGANGYIEQSVAALLELEQTNKDNAELLFHLGSCRLVEGRELLAIEVLSEAATLAEANNTPSYCDIMNNIGLAHFIMGNFVPAKACLKKALAHRPKDEETISNLAAVLLVNEEFATAEALLKEPMNASAPGADTMLNWADLLAATSRVPAAIDSLKRLVSIHSTCHVGYFKLGELYESESSNELAVSAYEMAYSLQDHRVNYAAALARVRLAAVERERGSDAPLPEASETSP